MQLFFPSPQQIVWLELSVIPHLVMDFWSPFQSVMGVVEMDRTAPDGLFFCWEKITAIPSAQLRQSLSFIRDTNDFACFCALHWFWTEWRWSIRGGIGFTNILCETLTPSDKLLSSPFNCSFFNRVNLLQDCHQRLLNGWLFSHEELPVGWKQRTKCSSGCCRRHFKQTRKRTTGAVCNSHQLTRFTEA